MSCRTVIASLPAAPNSGQYFDDAFVRVEQASFDQEVHAHRGDALGGREHADDRVLGPRPAGRGVGDATPQVHHGSAVDVHAHRGADFAALVEVGRERVEDRLELGCDPAVDVRHAVRLHAVVTRSVLTRLVSTRSYVSGGVSVTRATLGSCARGRGNVTLTSVFSQPRGTAQMGMLDGKVAVVTGAGNGVGRGEAIMLADHGAKVVVNDLGGCVSGEGEGDKRAADSVVDVIKARGGEAVACYDSVADFEGAKNIIGTAIDSFGRLDVLVNNAGVLRDRMMFSMSPEDFDTVLKVHLYGSWNTMHHASAYWRNESKEGRQPRASIVNTVSSAGLQGQASQINYGAAKAGIAAMTIIASIELKRYGVRANCVGPGGFTRMVAQAMKDIEVKNPEDYDAFDPMNPGNSAPAVVYLASDDALHVTGQVLRMVGNNLCVYKPWEMGEQFLATEKDGSPKQWDPVDIGRILNRYHFMSENPGIDAQKRA